LSDANLSYFLGIDSNCTNAQQILAGDRNVSVAGVQLGRGLSAIKEFDAVSWSSSMHNKAGNIALVDGSVHNVSERQFEEQLQQAHHDGIRLLVP
jgi:prepilin-type processing-associated H-X9-DG protein